MWTNVATVDEGRLELWVVGDNAGTLDFNLDGAMIRYEDPREAGDPIKDDVESKVVCALSLCWQMVATYFCLSGGQMLGVDDFLAFCTPQY